MSSFKPKNTNSQTTDTAKHIDLTQHQPHSQGADEESNNSRKGIFAIILVVVLAFALIISTVVYQTFFTSVERPKKLVKIKEGQTYYSIIHDWQQQENLPKFFSKSLAKVYVKLALRETLFIGMYETPKDISLINLLSILRQGADVSMVKLQIIEGKTAEDLYKKISDIKSIDIEVLNLPNEEIANELGIKADKPNGLYEHNLEGLFAPNTYFYAQGSNDKKILKDLYQNQKRILAREWKNREKGLPYKNSYEALIMASIIEKETGKPKERSLVSAVFINRLRKNMRLQTDPTIIYGMGENYQGDIRKKDIQAYTPYNTYRIEGLPPTPISLPSEASIHAAMHPAKTDALFFVATGKGGHKFSKTYEEHQKAVAEYLKVIRAKK